jgi:hypothetical protein
MEQDDEGYTTLRLNNGRLKSQLKEEKEKYAKLLEDKANDAERIRKEEADKYAKLLEDKAKEAERIRKEEADKYAKLLEDKANEAERIRKEEADKYAKLLEDKANEAEKYVKMVEDQVKKEVEEKFTEEHYPLGANTLNKEFRAMADHIKHLAVPLSSKRKLLQLLEEKAIAEREYYKVRSPVAVYVPFGGWIADVIYGIRYEESESTVQYIADLKGKLTSGLSSLLEQ